jgi:uncharacterized protein DUF3309
MSQQIYDIYPRRSHPGIAYVEARCVVSNVFQEDRMSTIVLVILVLLLVGALPTWPYSRSWGYYPSGGLGLIVLILLVLALSGRV